MGSTVPQTFIFGEILGGLDDTLSILAGVIGDLGQVAGIVPGRANNHLVIRTGNTETYNNSEIEDTSDTNEGGELEGIDALQQGRRKDAAEGDQGEEEGSF